MDNKKGFTFLEIVIALALFAVVMLGCFQIFNTGLNSNYRATQEIIATNLARGLMAEIMSKDFIDPQQPLIPALGTNPGENPSLRYTFDDVDDFQLWSKSPPITIGRPGECGGRAMNGGTCKYTDKYAVVHTIVTPNYPSFTRSVSVKYVNFLADGTYVENPPGAPPYKKITVTVSGSHAKNITIDEVKAKEEEE